jgi:hypothetical protein
MALLELSEIVNLEVKAGIIHSKPGTGSTKFRLNNRAKRIINTAFGPWRYKSGCRMNMVAINRKLYRNNV